MHESAREPFQKSSLEAAQESGDQDQQKVDAARKIATMVYALQAASFLLTVTFIAAVIVNYVKKDDVEGTWLESHFRWQIRTFWFALGWGAFGGVLFFLGIGFFILVGVAVWIIYRVAKGWLALADGKPMYEVQ